VNVEHECRILKFVLGAWHPSTPQRAFETTEFVLPMPMDANAAGVRAAMLSSAPAA
jgi:hypothetical protein